MMWSRAAVVLSLVLLPGCSSSRPHPAGKSPAAAPGPVAAQPPSSTNGVWVQVSHPPPPAASADNMAPNLLAWSALTQEYHARRGEAAAHYTFDLTNVSSEPIVIYDTSTTCDCTVAKLPSHPWVIPPDGTGQIHASLDLQGKTGSVTNYVVVFTSKGNRLLTVRADVPPR